MSQGHPAEIRSRTSGKGGRNRRQRDRRFGSDPRVVAWSAARKRFTRAGEEERKEPDARNEKKLGDLHDES